MWSQSSVANCLLPAIAISMVAIMLVPAEVWHHPSYDAIYYGFDSNLVYATSSRSSPATGIVNVTSDSIFIESTPQSQQTITLLTTPLSFQAHFDAYIELTGQNATPLKIGVWSPEESAGYFILFGGSNRTVTTEAVFDGIAGSSLIGGRPTEIHELGTYPEFGRLKVAITVDRQSQTITNHIVSDPFLSASSTFNASSTLTMQELPTLFRSVRLSLTLFSSSQSGTAKAVLNNYELALPSERWLAYTIDDLYAKLIVVSLLVVGGIICSFQLVKPARRFVHGLQSRWVSFRSATLSRRRFWKRLAVWIVSVAMYVGASSLFFSLGNAPFDILSEKLWSYLAGTQGVWVLYHTPLVVTSASAWNGIPHHELPFAYNYVLTYYFGLIGWTYKLLFGSSGQLLMNTFELEFLIKIFNTGALFLDGALSYWLLRLANVSNRTALVGTGLFLLNPALWFVSSIWGTTEPITIFFILLSIWAAEKQNPLLAWLGVGLGALTRPQMLVPAIVLGAVYLRKFSPKVNIRAASLTIIVAFILLAPFSLAISPSLPVDYELQVYSFHVSETANEPGLSTVSGSAFSVWPIITGIFNGAQSSQRFGVPATTPVYGWLDYAYLSALLSFGLLAIIIVAVLKGPKTVGNFSVYMPLLSLAMLGFLMLKTEIVSRYFFYALSLVIITRKSLRKSLFYTLITVLTATTFVTSYASTIVAAQLNSYPSASLNPSVNILSGAIFNLYSQDWFITVGSVANLAVTILLGISAFRTLAMSHRTQTTQTTTAPPALPPPRAISQQRVSLSSCQPIDC